MVRMSGRARLSWGSVALAVSVLGVLAVPRSIPRYADYGPPPSVTLTPGQLSVTLVVLAALAVTGLVLVVTGLVACSRTRSAATRDIAAP